MTEGIQVAEDDGDVNGGAKPFQRCSLLLRFGNGHPLVRILLLALVPCLFDEVKAMERQSLTILHTNDLHSRFEPWVVIARMVRQLRRELEAQGEQVLLLDSGDHLDFSNTATYGTGGMVNVHLLEALGYHAFTPGNNETIRQSVADLCALGLASRVPWLAANLNRPVAGEGPADAPEPLPGLPPSTVVRMGDLRVGVIGATVLFERIFPYLHIGWRDTQEAVASEASRLRAQGCHLVVLLSHLGLEEDRVVARSGLGVDVIVGGHSHDVLPEGEMQDGVAILQAGSHGRFLGQARLELERSAHGSWRVTRLQEHLRPVDPEGPPDPVTLQVLEEGRREAEERLAEVVAVLPEPLEHQMTGVSRLGGKVAAALRERWQADIGLVNGGAMIAGLSKGPVTRRDILDSFPSLVNPGLLEILGEDLWFLLEESADPRYFEKQVLGLGLRGEGVVLGRVFTDGLTWRVDLQAPVGRRIRDIRVQGEPLNPRQWYRAGACTLLAIPQAGYALPPRVRVLDRLWPDLVRDVFTEWLRRHYPPR